MPSIPQSLLWISLVVLWLFVLVPMLISKRDAVRRTSDVALATRVLNSSANSRLLKRTGPASGHQHDPNWKPSAEDHDDEDHEPRTPGTRSVVIAAVAEQAEPDYLDVDIVDEDSGALPVGAGMKADVGSAAEQPSLFDEAGEPDQAEVQNEEPRQRPEVDAAENVDEELADDEYEYVDDTSGLEAEEEPRATVSTGANRSRRMESSTAAAVSARKYRFRRRALMSMAAVMVLTAVLSFTVSSDIWWVCGSAAGMTVLYLGYLRRQTRIEEQVRRRRQQRMARSRPGVDSTRDREFDVVPSRLRRPGAAVLDIDDEDPIFEHLDEVGFARHYDLPRAAGQ
ncbi:MAG: gephyrin-like molybdotransferase receptor GlpR [Mycobacterium sp.]